MPCSINNHPYSCCIGAFSMQERKRLQEAAPGEAMHLNDFSSSWFIRSVLSIFHIFPVHSYLFTDLIENTGLHIGRRDLSHRTLEISLDLRTMDSHSTICAFKYCSWTRSIKDLNNLFHYGKNFLTYKSYTVVVNM